MIDYGSETVTELMDEEGSTMTTTTDYKAGQPKSPKRRKITARVRVFGRDAEREKYLEFSKELEDNPTWLDPNWSIERSLDGEKNGYYYVIKCYTLLEY